MKKKGHYIKKNTYKRWVDIDGEVWLCEKKGYYVTKWKLHHDKLMWERVTILKNNHYDIYIFIFFHYDRY